MEKGEDKMAIKLDMCHNCKKYFKNSVLFEVDSVLFEVEPKTKIISKFFDEYFTDHKKTKKKILLCKDCLVDY